jgi:putative ABC transport system ATP-binding protein
MMHRGQVIHDDAGIHKRRLRPDDLLARFEAVRRSELVDESAAALIDALYV